VSFLPKNFAFYSEKFSESFTHQNQVLPQPV